MITIMQNYRTSINEIGRHLNFSPIYLKRKMHSKGIQFQHLDFEELSIADNTIEDF
jgi:hypothetical protein